MSNHDGEMVFLPEPEDDGEPVDPKQAMQAIAQLLGQALTRGRDYYSDPINYLPSAIAKALTTKHPDLSTAALAHAVADPLLSSLKRVYLMGVLVQDQLTIDALTASPPHVRALVQACEIVEMMMLYIQQALLEGRALSDDEIDPMQVKVEELAGLLDAVNEANAAAIAGTRWEHDNFELDIPSIPEMEAILREEDEDYDRRERFGPDPL